MTHRRPLAICSLLAILVGCATPAFAEDLKWTPYSSKEAGFAAEFPNKDVIAEKKPNATHFHASIPGTDTDFRVALTKASAQPNREAALKELKRIRDVAVSSQKAELLNSKEIDVQEYPAIEFEFKKKIDDTTVAIYFMRFILVKDSFYQQLVGYSADKNLTTEKDRFFKSLTFIPAVTPAVPAVVTWTKYTSEEAGFEAEFPNKDVIVEKKPNATHFHVSIPGTDTDFRIAVTKSTAQPDRDAALKELKRIRDVAVNSQKAELLGSKEIAIQGHPAIEFEFKKKVSDTTVAVYYMQFVLVNDTFFQLLVGYPIDNKLTKEKATFFKSFKVL